MSAEVPSRIRIFVTDDVDPEGVELLTAESAFQVDVVPTLPPAELYQRIGEYDAFIGRSATKVSAELLSHASRLKVIGRAGVGIDNIDMAAATAMGIAVVNAPAGNTIAVAELFFGSVLSLLRKLPAAAASMTDGRWDRSDLLGSELCGRTLGIVGVGRIGGEVARRARAFGMTVIGYDPYIGDERFQALQVRRVASLDALLPDADILTVHVPLTDETRGMIGRRELSRLPGGAVVANLARGGIIDDQALLAALEAGTVRGALLDVYVTEPLPADAPLRSAANVVLTPHIGASTVEAQRNVAVDVCISVRDMMLRGELSRSINLATVSGRPWEELQPGLLLAQRAAAIGRALLIDRGVPVVRRITLRAGTDLVGEGSALLSAAALGALERVVAGERLNLISARAIAEGRGIELAVGDAARTEEPTSIEVTVSGGMESVIVSGVVAPGGVVRLTRIGGFRVDVAPRQALIILTNNDVPGVIGHVGTLLGVAGVNIAEYHQARLSQGGEALAAIAVDGIIDDDLRQRLLELPDVRSATILDFRGA